MANNSKYTAYKNKYQAEKYDRIALQVKKGDKEKIRSHAEENSESLNGFVNRAIDETIERDNEKQQDSIPTEENTHA